MRDLLLRAAARLAAFFPPAAASDWGLHANARDWPADDLGLSVDQVFAALDGITPGHAAAASASLLRAGEPS